MKEKEKNTQEDIPSNIETKDGMNDKNLRNFESTFLHDWKRVLKRVDEGRKCCEMLSRIFEEIIRVEREYETNLRNICELFRDFEDESCGIKNGIKSLKTNIERRCEQIKEFANSIEGEILNSTLSVTLINHKNVFDQIKVDGIENEKIVERTKKESIKSIESCVSAYESLINSIYNFQNNMYLHPLKKIELSNICINKYLLAKKKEDEYKNTIHIIKEIELKKEKRVKSILYSLESMDYKRISCIKDNIMKYLIFFTSYIRNVQYDLNTSINIFKDICAYQEINEYCLLHNKSDKRDFERIIFFTNIVSWPMLIDYLGELNNVHKVGDSKSKYEASQIGECTSEENSPTKQGNIFSSLFNVGIYKNLIQTNNKKTYGMTQNNFYTNIFNEIVFFNKRDTTEQEEINKKLYSEEEGKNKATEIEIKNKNENEIEKENENEIENEIEKENENEIEKRSESNCENPNLNKIEDIDVVQSDTFASDVLTPDAIFSDAISDTLPDSVPDDKMSLKENCNSSSDFEREEQEEGKEGTFDIIINTSSDEREKKEEEKEKEEEGGEKQNFKRTEYIDECLEKEEPTNSTSNIPIKERQKEMRIFGTDSTIETEKRSKIINSDNNNNHDNNSNDNNHDNNNNNNNNNNNDGNCGHVEHKRKRKQCKESFNTNDNTSSYNLSHNMKDDLKKVEIYFNYYLNNLYAGKFEKISRMNITKYFNTYSNRFVFCQCLMNCIRRKKTKFLFLKSIAVFANVILKFLDYCGVYVDYWSAIYILVASQNFYFELARNTPVNINMLLSKYTFFEKSKHVGHVKNVESCKKKKITNGSSSKGFEKSGTQSEKDTCGLDEGEVSKGETFFQKMRDKINKITADSNVDNLSQKLDNSNSNNSSLPPQIKDVVNIYESQTSDTVDISNLGVGGDDNDGGGNKNSEQIKSCEQENEEKVEKKLLQEKAMEDNSEVKGGKGNPEEKSANDVPKNEQYQHLFLHKFLYAHNLWNNVKFWEVCFLVIISEIIQEIILLEKYRYENKEEMITKYFFFSKYFNFYNSMIKFGLSVNQIGLLLNKIFHHFDLKNDPVARKYFFQIIDITTNKNISLNYIKMDTPEDANTNYKNYYLQYYNTLFSDEKTFKKNT